MEGNKDEAARCIEIAEAAIATGNKQRALKFIKIAQRLNKDLSVDALLAACERLDSAGSTSSEERKPVEQRSREAQPSNSSSSTNGERAYTEEHVKLVREIKRNKDYYAVLGVEKTCTVEEIRKAYRKLSLKVHPDKNQAPGSDEAFKIVSKAFKCLSDDDSRRQYDQIGHVDEFEYNQQHDVRRRRRRNPQDMFHDDFDPDEIFRSFFGQTEMFRAAHVYRSRHMGGQQRQQHVHEGGFNYMVLIQILPFLVIFLLAYLPFSEPDYSLQKNFSYQYQQMTEKYGIEYFVKSDFDHHYPPGSPSRASLEDQVVTEYKNVLGRYCHVELQRRQWNRKYPTPHCDKLKDLGVVY